MKKLIQGVGRFIRSEDGPTATEYALLIGIISIGVITAMGLFGDRVNNIYVILSGTLTVF